MGKVCRKVIFIAVAAISTLAALVTVLEFFTGVGIWGWVAAVLRAFVSVSVPLWAAIAGGILIFVIIILTSNLRDKYPWADFTEMEYGEWKFKWGYPEIGNTISSICKKCDCRLSDGIYPRMHLYCPECNSKYPPLSGNTLSDVKKVVINKISKWEERGK